jgi:hypothetical protein
MNARLTRISPRDLGLLLGFIGLVVSILSVVLGIITIGLGKTVNLQGFLTLTFTGSIDSFWIIVAYPLLNAIAGVIVGFIGAWLYNFYARFFGGLSIHLDRYQ